MAEEFAIKSRRKLAIASIVAPSDFKLRALRAVGLTEYIDQHVGRLTPYCIDLPRREVLLVETSREVDLLTCKPFLYEGQRLHGNKIIRASFDELHQAVSQGRALFLNQGQLSQQQVDDKQQIDGQFDALLFLFSTGRCGSTLLGQLLGDCAGVVTVSEPDYFTQLPFLVQRQSTEVIEALQSVTYDLSVLLLAYVRVRYPTGKVVLKLRSQCNESAEMIQAIFPNARKLFLYRNGMETVNSFCSVLRSHPLIQLSQILNSKYFPLLNHIPIGLLNLIPFLRSVIKVMAPLSTQLRFMKVGIGTGTGVFTLAWLSGLDKVFKITAHSPSFFDAILRYEELQKNPIEVVSILLMRLNLPSINQNSKEKMAMTLLKDSQQGSDLASLDEYVLTGLDERLITRAVHLHEVVEDVDYRLPGLITGSVNAKTTPSLEESNYE
ncbi:MAG: hypothetical protein KUG82_00855 [Pseudomonadales bacterium]|nr:hypothetical protein [Pseudomonadales bacterium]